MFLSSELWLGRAAQARNAAEQHPQQAREFTAYAEECDLAAALTVLGHTPEVETPPNLPQCSDAARVWWLIEGGRRNRSPRPAYRPTALRVVS